MTLNKWQLVLYDIESPSETIVFCDAEEISFFSKYTLSQMNNRKRHFECPYAIISKKGNVCCDLNNGQRCPTYVEITQSRTPPAEPLSRLRSIS